MVIYGDRALVHERREIRKGVIAPLPRTILKESIRAGCAPDGFYFVPRRNLVEVIKRALREGQPVRFKRDGKIQKGVVVHVDPLVVRSGGVLLFDLGYKDLLFERLPLELAFLEHLRLIGRQSGRCDLAYLLGGIGWRALYNASLEGRELLLEGSVWIHNGSGADFFGTKIAVVAGRIGGHRMVARPRVMAMAAEAKRVQERQVEGYHRYDLPGRWDLPDGSDLAVRYLRQRVPFRKRLRARCGDVWHNFGTRSCRFRQIFEFEAPKPLPAGTVRLYGEETFLGQTFMEARAKGERVELAVGEDFDLALRKRVVRFEESKRKREVEIEYSVTNPKKRPAKVEIVERIAFGKRVRIEAQKPYRRLDASTIVYELAVPAEGEVRFVARYIFWK